MQPEESLNYRARKWQAETRLLSCPSRYMIYLSQICYTIYLAREQRKFSIKREGDRKNYTGVPTRERPFQVCAAIFNMDLKINMWSRETKLPLLG